MESQIISLISSTFGISSDLVGIAIVIGATMAMSLCIYMQTGNMFLVFICSTMGLMVGVFTGLVPVWIVLIQGLFIGFLILSRGSFGFSFGNRKVDVVKEYRKDVASELLEQSNKWNEYHNNLDELLGIKTINILASGGLRLDGKYLQINDKEYDWFITDKAKDKNVFKVIGLHKSDSEKNVAYLLGEEAHKPFLTNLGSSYIEDGKDIKTVIEESEKSKVNSAVFGVMSTVVASTMMSSILNTVAWQDK